MKFIIIALVAFAHYCAAKEVEAEPVDFMPNVARCPNGYSLVSCGCDSGDSCSFVAVKFGPSDPSGYCYVEGKGQVNVKASGKCRNDVDQTLVIDYERENDASCPEGQTVSQCFAYGKERGRPITALETEKSETSCKITSDLSNLTHQNLMAICTGPKA